MSISSSFRRGAITLALLAGSTPLLASAQVFQAPQATPTADRLAAEMRALAANPDDLRALISAGELSTRLGEAAAAMQFFARAEKIDPRNPRIAAGRGRALVAMERPGQALRYFAEAERGGLTPIEYAADRGLAYDLMGFPANAQADYRLALTRGADAEVTRRLALSLGISGDREEAVKLLTPLLRANDRSAWRVQAMVVAMDGDFAAADRIAASMLPGFGQNLGPFFRRLPALGPGDRAFAGHFGQLSRTPQRMADASMAPAIPAVARGAAPVALADAGAARAAPQTPATAGRTRAERRGQRTELASNRRTERRGTQARTREPVRMAAARPEEKPLAVQARLTSVPPAAPAQTAPARQSVQAASAQAAPSQQAPAPSAPVQLAAKPSSPARSMVQAVPQREIPGVTLAAAPEPAGPVGARLSTGADGVLTLSSPVAPTPQPATSASPSVASAPPPAAPLPAPGFSQAAAPSRIGAEDDTIARIMRGISVPASELGVAPMPGHEALAGTAAPIAAPAERPAATPAGPVAATPAPRNEEAAKPVAKAAPKAGEAAKPAARAPAKAPAKVDPAKAEPARHWVQVAGGARAADLHKDWDRLAKASPAAFKGKQGWTTPLRATNRLLAGPFKTQAEAQQFVNSIAKDGLSAFAWQSEAGQKIERLKP